jgi:hypothetical protein
MVVAYPSAKGRKREWVRHASNMGMRPALVFDRKGDRKMAEIQERHFADVKEGSLRLAGEKDPREES